MNDNSKFPERKQIRLKRFDYSSNAAYFITICTEDKKKLLGEFVGYDACDVPQISLSKFGILVKKNLCLMDNKYKNVFVDKYVIMPNHIHFILIVSDASAEAFRDSDKVGFYGTSQASYPTYDVSAKAVLSGSEKRQHEIVPKFVSLLKRYINHDIGFNIWQRRYYDHIIRNENDYRNIWNYIENNPAHWAEDRYYS